MSDAQHFEKVLQENSLTEAMRRTKLERIEIYTRGANNNDGVKIWKDDWTLPLPATGIEGINVHFESRHPGQIQIDVEVFPYEGSIANDAERVAELRPQLQLKSQLLTAIREELSNDEVCIRRLGATTKSLRDPSASSTLCAIKFCAKQAEDADAESDAAFFATVINHLTPILDRMVSDTRKRLPSNRSADR